MNGSMPTANIMALGVKRPRAQGEMEMEDEQMLPPEMNRDFSGGQFLGNLGNNISGNSKANEALNAQYNAGRMRSPQEAMSGDPAIAQDPYGIPSQEDPNNMAGRVFTPGVGWKKLPTM
jgi:hypothetical protein